MTDNDRHPAALRPTPNRPFLGFTVLVVEDSRYACDAMRLLCLRSGARIRRADCLQSARRHLKVYRPTIIIIDMGLPDGSGADLIRDLVSAPQKVPVILAVSGDSFVEDEAIAAGADGFLDKPLKSLIEFQNVVLSILPKEMRPEGLRLVRDEPIQPDPVAFLDDMAHADDLLNGEEPVFDYVTQFLAGVADSAGDTDLAQATRDLARARIAGDPWGAPLNRLRGEIKLRLTDRIAI